jgi:hypothetical protein
VLLREDLLGSTHVTHELLLVVTEETGEGRELSTRAAAELEASFTAVLEDVIGGLSALAVGLIPGGLGDLGGALADRLEKHGLSVITAVVDALTNGKLLRDFALAALGVAVHGSSDVLAAGAADVLVVANLRRALEALVARNVDGLALVAASRL